MVGGWLGEWLGGWVPVRVLACVRVRARAQVEVRAQVQVRVQRYDVPITSAVSVTMSLRSSFCISK